MSALRPPGMSTARFVTGMVNAAATAEAATGSGGAGTSSAEAGADAARAAAATLSSTRPRRKDPLEVTRSS